MDVGLLLEALGPNTSHLYPVVRSLDLSTWNHPADRETQGQRRLAGNRQDAGVRPRAPTSYCYLAKICNLLFRLEEQRNEGITAQVSAAQLTDSIPLIKPANNVSVKTLSFCKNAPNGLVSAKILEGFF